MKKLLTILCLVLLVSFSGETSGETDIRNWEMIENDVRGETRHYIYDENTRDLEKPSFISVACNPNGGNFPIIYYTPIKFVDFPTTRDEMNERELRNVEFIFIEGNEKISVSFDLAMTGFIGKYGENMNETYQALNLKPIYGVYVSEETSNKFISLIQNSDSINVDDSIFIIPDLNQVHCLKE